jgi:predicted ATP-grasp superfamily ATP-dependent carboligase
MVEFKFDEATGDAALMEVNGRFWGSLPLALHAGADFPYALYRCAQDPGFSPSPRVHRSVLCRSLAGDTKWFFDTIRDPRSSKLRAFAAYLGAFRPGMRYFIWAADDPRPAVFQFFRRIRTAIRTAMNLLLSLFVKPRPTTAPQALTKPPV